MAQTKNNCAVNKENAAADHQYLFHQTQVLEEPPQRLVYVGNARHVGLVLSGIRIARRSFQFFQRLCVRPGYLALVHVEEIPQSDDLAGVASVATNSQDLQRRA